MAGQRVLEKLSVIIDNFSKGEVSPLALARLSSAEVRDGLAYAENLTPDPRGPMISRQGFAHRAVVPNTLPYGLIFQFEMYEGKTLVLVFVDNKVKVYNAKTKAYMQEVSSPYTTNLLVGTDRTQDNVVGVVAPDATKMYFLHRSVAPWVMTITDLSPVQENLVSITFAAVAFTAKPAEWTGDNHPIVLTFFQDRSWWAGTMKNPETFWGSKSGAANHHNMTLGANAADAVKFVLQQHGLIKWMTGYKDLLIGTSFGEYIATSNGGVIIPSDIHIDVQSAYGSKAIQPEFIGDEVLYISPDGRKLRSMWWKWMENGWKSIDLTFYSDHLSFSGIKQLAYVRDPYSKIYMLTGNNTILSSSYLRVNDESTIGFSRIVLAPELSIISMNVIQLLGNSSLWVLAQTEVEGTTQLHLMEMDSRDIYNEELVLLDNYTETTMTSGSYEIDGLDYLEGQTITIMADNALLPEQVVVDGKITLEDTYETIHIGHTYSQKITTLPFIMYQESMGHQMKFWNKYWLSLLRSFPPLINGKRPPTRNAITPMGTGEPDRTGLTQVEGEGWDREGRITIEQDIPRSLIILGIYGELAMRQV